MTLILDGDVRYVEAEPGEPLLARPGDASLVIEACLSHRVKGALLYPPNLTPRFFDLSSGDAGTIVEKLRRFGIRLAVVCAPGSVRVSRRFGEFVADDFRLFATREEACAWLAAAPGAARDR